MRIVFVGGGTGGHFYPLIAVAEALVQRTEKPELYYMGPDPYKQDLLTQLNITYIHCPAGKLRLYFSVQNFIDIFRNIAGLFVALWKLFVLYPDVIFSKGGFASGPVLFAARLLRIPVVIHESDAIPGRANMAARSFAKYIAISYPDTIKYFNAKKTALTGIPLRRTSITQHPDPFTALGIPNDAPLIYVTGGSLGAERINNIILRCLDNLLPYYRIFHQVGGTRRDQVVLTAQSLITNPALQNRYYVADSVDAATVSALYSAAALVITRAGSTTLFEIAAHGKPSIVIPIPEDVSRDQRTNAYAYAQSGGTVVVEERNLTEHLLTTEIHSIMTNTATYQNMSQGAASFAITDAAEKIASLLISIGAEHT